MNLVFCLNGSSFEFICTVNEIHNLAGGVLKFVLVLNRDISWICHLFFQSSCSTDVQDSGSVERPHQAEFYLSISSRNGQVFHRYFRRFVIIFGHIRLASCIFAQSFCDDLYS